MVRVVEMAASSYPDFLINETRTGIEVQPAGNIRHVDYRDGRITDLRRHQPPDTDSIMNPSRFSSTKSYWQIVTFLAP